MKNDRTKPAGFTLLELVVVLAMITVLLWMLMPRMTGNRARPNRIKCVNNLKQCTLALKIFAADHDDRYPYQLRPPRMIATDRSTLSLTNAVDAGPASMRFPGQTQQAAWAHWGALSNELGSPKVFICPGDRPRHRHHARDWSTNEHGFYAAGGHERMSSGDTSHQLDNPDRGNERGYDNSISYFVSFNAEETIPAGILAGDFNLQWDGRSTSGDPYHDNPRGAGNQYLKRDHEFENLTWVLGHQGRGWDLHPKAGNIALTDGSIVQVNTAQLREAARMSTNAWRQPTMHLLIPR